MTIQSSRGSAAVIAMIVLSLTGLTVVSYVTSSTTTAASDAASVAGWRALYATDAGLASTIAFVGKGSRTASMAPLTGAPAATISGSKLLGFSVSAASAQSTRAVTTRVTMGGSGRPIVSAWTLHPTALAEVSETDEGTEVTTNKGKKKNGN